MAVWSFAGSRVITQVVAAGKMSFYKNVKHGFT
jgi:hypothetical protein